jgi:outer membrane protein OmpA-like peptidoglycan-associated protein
MNFTFASSARYRSLWPTSLLWVGLALSLSLLISACGGTGAAQKQTEKAQLAVKQYDPKKAERHFKQALEKDPYYFPAHQEYIGLLVNQQRRREALAQIDRYLELDSAADVRYYALKGDLFKALREFEPAAEAYQTFLANPGSYDQLEAESRAKLKTVEQVLYDQRYPSARHIQRMSPAINSPAEEYLPLMPADGSFMIFTRRTRGREDFYVSLRQDSSWSPARAIVDLNSPGNEGAATLSADGKILVFTRCQARDSYGQCDLYLSTRRNGRWTEARNMGPRLNTRYNETQPAFSPDGRSLYFASNRPGGVGKMDIWRIDWLATGEWSVAVALDTAVNSADNEKTPFLHYDNQTLYFTSDRPDGYGSSDLYVSRKKKGNWQPAQNMRWPINTPAAEGTIYVARDGTTGYMGRRERVGMDYDIYRFDLDTSVAAQATTYVKGRVIDAISRKGVAAQVMVYDGNGSRTIAQIQTDTSGRFLAPLPVDGSYQLFAEAPGYTFQSERYTYAELQSRSPETPWLVELQPVRREEAADDSAPVIMRNLLFRTGTAEWLPSSETELRRLQQLLEDQPHLQIEIRGHTDDVGSAQANQILSMRRAKAVYDYLVEHGIDTDRLRYTGFGESQPLVPNDSDAARQKNRRTEFVILK